VTSSNYQSRIWRSTVTSKLSIENDNKDGRRYWPDAAL